MNNRPQALLVCRLVTMPYRVMRCLSDAGFDVFVVGSKLSSGLRHSKFCKGFKLAKNEFDGRAGEESLAEILEEADRLGADLICGGDPYSWRTVTALRDRTTRKVFPGPSLALFDELNDKSRFMASCGLLGILHPRSRVYADKCQIKEALLSGELSLPLVAKPLSEASGVGVIELRRSPDGPEVLGIDKVDYSPVLVQTLIEGEDIGASIACYEGKVTGFICHSLVDGVYRTMEGQGVLADLQTVAEHFSLTGVYNFDMRVDEKGDVYYLECNPRLFYKIDLSMVSGVNFADVDLVSRSHDSVHKPKIGEMKSTRGLIKSMLMPWTLGVRDREMLRYYWADPVSYIRQLIKLDWDI